MFPLTDPTSIVLTVLAAILLVPLLLERIKIPYIIGLIAAGMALGPHGFHILEYDASFKIFGEVGILYLMFLAGVEIDMFHMRRNWKPGLAFGLITFAIPMATGYCSAVWILGYDSLAASLIGVMFASHTLLTYPVINKFGLSNSRPAVLAVCGTIVAVLLALIVLAETVQISINGTFNLGKSLLLGGKLIIYVFAWRFIAPWLTRTFMRKVNDGVMRYVYILAIVMLMSVTAAIIGVASILGAFYSGLVLNRFIPVRSVLMRRTEFVGNAIFIPYFLIGVGMVINVGSLFEGLGVVKTAAVMSGMALLSKWIAAFATQKSFKMDSTEGGLLFGLTSGKAAATIAATMVGFHCGILDSNVLNGAVMMILSCCIVASVTTQKCAIRLRMRKTDEEQAENHNEEDAMIVRPLVAVSNPVTAEGLMKLTALGISKGNTRPPVILFVANSDDVMHRAMGESSIQLAMEAAGQIGVKSIKVLRYDVNIVAGITNAMKERDCNLLVLGLHRPSTGFDSFFGSMEERIVKSTNGMIIFSRLFIPINTIGKLFITIPPKAEYETGFRTWVVFMANLAYQLSAPVEIMASKATEPFLIKAFDESRIKFDYRFQPMENWDDFIILSSRVDDDDLLVTVLARRGSISYGQIVESMPNFLDKYFRRHNLLVTYPEQFGRDNMSNMHNDLNALTV